MNKVLVEDFPKICRLCLGSGLLQPILNVKDLDLLNTITNLNIKQGDKLPENICCKCLRQLEDISLFISTCETNDKTLRKIIIIQGFTEQTDSFEIENDNERYYDTDDFKNEEENSNDTLYEFSIKQEFILEPKLEDDNDKRDAKSPISCENCSENFLDFESLHDHYKEFVMCRPSDYDIETSSLPNILSFLKKIRKEQKPRKKKEECDESEPEYIKGRKLKGKRRFLCSYCGKNYTRKNGLDRHILSHTGVKPFECKECGKRYITKDILKTHLLTHTGVKTHKCTICGKMFTQSSHLSYHMRRHSGEKPFTCTFCAKGFLSNYHLERHKLMHTGVKPFECNQCGKQFVRGTTLRDHLLIHSGEKPFQCQHCGKQFNRKQSLTNHVLVHTGQVRHINSTDAIVEFYRSGTSNDAEQNNISGNGRELLTVRSGNMNIIDHNTGSPIDVHRSASRGVVAIGNNNSMFSESTQVNSGY